MSLKSVQPSPGLQQPQHAAKTGAGEELPVAPGAGTDKVRLSSQGRMMSNLSKLMAPVPGTMGKLSNALAGDLKNLLRQNGIDPRASLGFEVDSEKGKVSVRDDRPDARKIAALIENHPGIERQIQDIAALGRHLASSEQSADLRQASRVAQNATQVRAFASAYDSRSSATNAAQDFSPILRQHPGNTGYGSRAIANYAAISATYSAAASISVIVNGADVQVRSN